MAAGERSFAETYRLDAHRLPEAKARARRRAALAIAPATAAAVAALAWGARDLRAVADVAWWPVALAIVAAPLLLWSAGRKVRRSWNAFEMTMGADWLRVATRDMRRVEVRREEVVGISEDPWGLLVRTAARRGGIPIPAIVESYAEIRRQMAEWHPIRRSRLRQAGAWLLFGAGIAGGGLLAWLAIAPALTAAGVVLSLGLLTFAVVELALSPSVSPNAKLFAMAAAAAGLLYLLVHAARRVG